jgi:hypothetical protein
MQKKRHRLPLSLVILAALAAPRVWAAGFSENGSGAVLGQPLDFSVTLRFETAEAPGPECVSAEVTAGDRRLPAATVRTALQITGPDTARVRVGTLQGVDEPVIGILLNVGCQVRISRHFVLLADPPLVAAPALASAPPFAADVTRPGSGPAALAAGGAPAADGPAAFSPPVTPATRPSQPPTAATAPASPARRAVATAPRTAEARRGPARPEPRSDIRSEAPGQANAPRSAAAATPARAPSAAAPRLRLDMVEPRPSAGVSAESVAVEQALLAVAQAASAARAAASAAAISDARIASLELTVQQLRAEARASQDLAFQLRERMARADSTSPWLWPLVVGLVLLGALAAWLGWQLASLRRTQRQTWQQAAAAPRRAAAAAAAADVSVSKQPTSPIPFVTSEIALPVKAAPAPRQASAPAWPPPVPAPAPYDETPSDFPVSAVEAGRRAMQATLPLSQALAGGSPRDVSIEELIDLEQQAEFFVVLGQDEAAIDLLMEHLRSTGGGSPLPYLKLLEIHHRRGHREAYDRTRARFNQRFNAYAPDWESGLQHGRSLEDYPGIVPRLQQVWPRPLDAMAELEVLLFRKSRGELFDLPAYRDVLFLYSLARDLLDREAAHSGDVDLLLPLADGGEFRHTAAHPYFGLQHDSVFDGLDSDGPPTAPVDLDLSVADRTVSIVDPLSARPPGRPAD